MPKNESNNIDKNKTANAGNAANAVKSTNSGYAANTVKTANAENIANDKIEVSEQPELVRINKFLSEAKFCSRRQADQLISEGKVKIDGRVALTGEKVRYDQVIQVGNEIVNKSDDFVYLAYNKPAGVTCTTDRRVFRNIVVEVNFNQRIFPVGRLDKDSTGLILLTNDGEIVNKILRAGNYHEKEYMVTVDRIIDEDFVSRMSSGIPVLNTVTRKCVVKKLTPNTFKIILTQGLNRQIRRMCEYLGYEIISLKRTRIMNIGLGTLKIGQYRDLTQKELAELNNQIKDSQKTSFGPDNTNQTDDDEE
jgi:23S rRNA pseudouridine2604 synthase